MSFVLSGIAAIIALAKMGKVAGKIVVGTARVAHSVTKIIPKKRRASSRKKRGVTLGQVIALPAVAIASVCLGLGNAAANPFWTMTHVGWNPAQLGAIQASASSFKRRLRLCRACRIGAEFGGRKY